MERSVESAGVNGNGDENTPTTRENTSQKRRVYSLEVEDAHEFFANGVLVSNCFALMFYELARLSKGSGAFFQSTEKPEVKPIVLTSQGFKMNMTEYMEERERNLEGF